jgi:hypothetical protein
MGMNIIFQQLYSMTSCTCSSYQTYTKKYLERSNFKFSKQSWNCVKFEHMFCISVCRGQKNFGGKFFFKVSLSRAEELHSAKKFLKNCLPRVFYLALGKEFLRREPRLCRERAHLLSTKSPCAVSPVFGSRRSFTAQAPFPVVFVSIHLSRRGVAHSSRLW